MSKPLFFSLRSKETALSEINQDFLYFYWVNRCYTLVCTPNSGTTKTKLPPKIWIWMQEFLLLGLFAPSWLSSWDEMFCVQMSHRFLFIRATKSGPYLIFYHPITVPHCHCWQCYIAMHVLSLSSCERGHNSVDSLFRCRERSKRTAYVR